MTIAVTIEETTRMKMIMIWSFLVTLTDDVEDDDDDHLLD